MTGGCVALGKATPFITGAIKAATPLVTETFKSVATVAISAKDTWVQTASENYIAATVGTVATMAILLTAKKNGIISQEKSLPTIVSNTAKVALIGVGSAIANVSAIAAAPLIASSLYPIAEEVLSSREGHKAFLVIIGSAVAMFGIIRDNQRAESH